MAHVEKNAACELRLSFHKLLENEQWGIILTDASVEFCSEAEQKR